MKILSIAFILYSFADVGAQHSIVDNTDGFYRISIPQTWLVKKDGAITDVYSPEEGHDDSWQEYVGISTGEANGLSLQDAFDYYMKVDFPGYYPQFQVIKTGKETINGLSAFWGLCSYRASGMANDQTKSAVIYNLFYLVHKSDTLYFLNGIAVESEYPRFEDSFKQIIRSFSITK